MVNFGHIVKSNKDKGIQHIGYHPPEEYSLDLEVLSVEDLRHRIDTSHFRAAQRIEFYQLIYITHGACTHSVDFQPIWCEAGTVLILRPAQAQQLNLKSDWDGWLVIFRSEFLLPLQRDSVVADVKLSVDLDALPNQLMLDREQSEHLTTVIVQMQIDALMQVSKADLHNLLRHQLYALFLRLQIVHGQNKPEEKLITASYARFQHFKQLVEKNFAKWHLVSDYSRIMGCSEKSLTRAVNEVSGSTAKSFISARVNLEAKRLLAHTAMPIGLISDSVGFDEATNFVKFFKREAGCSPSDFRRQYAGNLLP